MRGSLRNPRLTSFRAALALATSLSACNAILGIGDPIIVESLDGGDASMDAPSSPATDAASDGDATSPSGTCAHGSPFGPPELVPGLEDVVVISARLNHAETNIYLSALVEGEVDLFVSGRSSPDERFGDLTRLSVSTVTDDYWPTVDMNERVMFFESGVVPTTPGSGSRIWYAFRDNSTAAFGSARLTTFFDALPPGATDSSPYLVPTGNALYFTSVLRPIGGDAGARAHTQDIWAMETNSSGTMLQNRRLSEISTDKDTEQFPVVTDDEREILFARQTAGEFDDEIWVAQRDRPDLTALFGPPVKVDEDAGRVNTGAREWPSWISSDNCRFYFIRASTDGVVSEARVWMTRRTPE